MVLKKIIISTIFLVLGYGFWLSPDFKEISAGVAIFLFGMLSLEEGFRAFTGGPLEKILKASTDKLWKSISFGFVSTAIMQSSSLVSVLTISFIGAGLIGLAQGIGIILGANIGTTTGAWLMAGFGLKVKISAYAMPMLVFGVLLVFQKSKSLKGLGYVLTGLGFLFLGIHYMKEGFESFKDSVDLASFAVDGFKGLVVYVGIGILATVIMQSSHATIVLILAALGAGQINYENAIALTIGANIGTTITAVIGSLSSNIDGKRLAGAHFIFNMVTAIVTLALFDQILYLVQYISDNIGISTENHTLRLAVFDSFFKIMGVAIFVPFVDKLVSFLNHTFTSNKSQTSDGILKEKYLSDGSLELPVTAISALDKESKRLYNSAAIIISHSINVSPENIFSDMDVKEVLADKYSKHQKFNFDKEYNSKIKYLYGDILAFSSKAQIEMPKEYAEQVHELKNANRNIIRATKNAKHLHVNLIRYLASDNSHIRDEYIKISKRIIKLLRRINKISTSKKEEEITVSLGKAKVLLQKNDIIANGKLDKLIRKDLITNEMATSLMNDSTYATDLITELTSAAETIFIDISSDLSEIQEEMKVTHEEIDTILEKKENQ